MRRRRRRGKVVAREWVGEGGSRVGGADGGGRGAGGGWCPEGGNFKGEM